MEQTEGLQLPLAPGRRVREREGQERAEVLIRYDDTRGDHVVGENRVVLPEGAGSRPEDAHTHTAARAKDTDGNYLAVCRAPEAAENGLRLDALGNLISITVLRRKGAPRRLNQPTLLNHDGFGSETYAREELPAEIAAMMTGEQLGAGTSRGTARPTSARGSRRWRTTRRRSALRRSMRT